MITRQIPNKNAAFIDFLRTVNEIVVASERTAERWIFVLALRTVGDPVAAVGGAGDTVEVIGGAARVQCAGVTANLEAGALCKTAVSNVCCVNILNAMISRLVTTVGADTFTFMLIRHIINMYVLHPSDHFTKFSNTYTKIASCGNYYSTKYFDEL